MTEPVLHRFRFATTARPPLALLGIRPGTAWIRFDGALLDVRFGRWRVACTLDDVESAGPSRVLSARDIGVRLTPAECGVAFASSTLGGVRIRFSRPLPGAGPLAAWSRPTLVVTAVDPDLLIERLGGHRPGAPVR